MNCHFYEENLPKSAPFHPKYQRARICASPPDEVDQMITNVEKVIKKSVEDAEKQGMKKVAKQMLADGEPIPFF